MENGYAEPGYWEPGYAVGDGGQVAQKYLDRITSEHNQRPKFMASVLACVQPLAGIADVETRVSWSFDLDTAAGAQLDVVGEWVGFSRNIAVPILGVYFSFDDAALGFDLGVWKGPFDPSSGITRLSDEPYRILLRAKIALNSWDGSIPQSNEIWAKVFAGTGIKVYTIDNGDMTMATVLGGTTSPDALTRALFSQAYLQLKPEGVRHLGTGYITVLGAPAFGFDAQTGAIGGFDRGAWVAPLT